MSLAHPISFTIALLIVIVILLIRRQFRLRMIASILLAIAAGAPIVKFHPAGEVTVMLDASPSTRGATFRSRSVLRHRVAELIGSAKVRWIEFADEQRTLAIDDPLDAVEEISSDQTTLAEAGDNPVLLFSDGNFASAHYVSPTYPVIDPLLDHPDDAAVRSLSIDGKRAVATVQGGNSSRTLLLNGNSVALPPGESIFSTTTDRSVLTARVVSHDRWPENDSLSAFAPPSATQRRLWVSDRPAPEGFQAIAPANLPGEDESLLDASLIVLDDIPANALDQSQQQAMSSYVRDLAGNLLLVIGPRTSADHHVSAMMRMSPLSIDPPTPRARWVILLDSSGSMAADLHGESRLQHAAESATLFLHDLPPADTVSVGDFAGAVSWWIRDAAAASAADALPIPTNLAAHGPTNLDAALEQLLSMQHDALPTQILIISDGAASIDQPAALARRLASQKMSVSLLSISTDQPTDAVKQLIDKTGGQRITDDDPAHWINELHNQKNSESDNSTSTTTVHFKPEFQLHDRALDRSSRTWPRRGAIVMTSGDGPNAAYWSVGLGRVGAIAFSPNSAELSAWESTLDSTPQESETQVEWTTANPLTVDIRAARNGRHLNDEHLSLVIGERPPLEIPQVGPGEYRLSTTAPSTSVTAAIQWDHRVISRRMLAGRYPAEFDRIGNNIPALKQIASDTGGKIVPPTQHSPIDFHWPVHAVSLAGWFAAAAAIALACDCLFRRSAA